MTRVAAAVICLCLLLSSCALWGETKDSSGPQPVTVKENAAGLVILSDEQIDAVEQMVLQSAAFIPDAYDAPSSIPVYTMAQFLYQRMMLDGVHEQFEHSRDGSLIFIPMEQLRRYAYLYFGMSELEMDFASLCYVEGQSFAIPNPDRKTDNDIVYTINRIEPGAGCVSVSVDAASDGVVYQRLVYTLRADSDGAIKLYSMMSRPIEFGVYAVNAAQTLNRLIGVPVNSLTLDAFRFLPFEDEMLCMISNGLQLNIGLLDMQTYESDRFITIDGLVQDEEWEVQVHGKQIFVYLRNRVIVLDDTLVRKMEIEYPQGLIEQCDEYTSRFVLSPDLNYIAYTNEQGLQFYNLAAQRTILMYSNVMNGANPEKIWQPVAFTETSNELLARRTEDAGNESSFDRLGVFSTRDPSDALEETIRISSNDDTIFVVRGDRMLIYAPDSVRLSNVSVETDLERTCVDYNLATGTARTFSTNFPLTEDSDSTENMLLTPDYLYRVQKISIGEDMVTSLSLQAFRNPLDYGMAERIAAADFGYVDRTPTLTLAAASSGNRLIVRCSGMFCKTLAII